MVLEDLEVAPVEGLEDPDLVLVAPVEGLEDPVDLEDLAEVLEGLVVPADRAVLL